MSCQKCGSRESTRIECAREDEVVAVGALCRPCLGRALDDAAELRADFEALLAAGVARDEANAIMIARIDGRIAMA